ncbi:MAG: transport permease protein [Acidobacteriota bacterium]
MDEREAAIEAGPSRERSKGRRVMAEPLGEAGQPRVVRIEARRGLALEDLRELWDYRELLGVLAARDVRVRYRQTVLGIAWAVLRPLLAAGILTVVFGRLARVPSDGVPYALFALLGVIPWTFFSTGVAGASESLVGAQPLVTRVYLPRLLLPLSALGAPAVDLGVSITLAVAATFASGFRPGIGLLLALVGVAILLGAAIGLGSALAAMNAMFRDVRHIVPFALQLGMYASPVVYPSSLVPEQFRWIYFANPVAGGIEAFRAGLTGRAIEADALLVSSLAALTLVAGGVTWFLRVQRRLADVV